MVTFLIWRSHPPFLPSTTALQLPFPQQQMKSYPWDSLCRSKRGRFCQVAEMTDGFFQRQLSCEKETMDHTGAFLLSSAVLYILSCSGIYLGPFSPANALFLGREGGSIQGFVPSLSSLGHSKKMLIATSTFLQVLWAENFKSSLMLSTGEVFWQGYSFLAPTTRVSIHHPLVHYIQQHC